MRISVVINTYNRRHSLGRTLEALRQQRHGDFEVVVVSGPSTDGTDDFLDAWRDACVVRKCPEVNISMSRNLGIAAANGDVVAFIDDDAIPEADWLAKLAAAYEDPDIGGAGGIVWDHTGVALQYRYSLCDRLGRTHFTGEPPDHRAIPAGAERFVYLQGTNSSFRRTVLAEVGGFDEEIEYYHDETDLAARINDRGHVLVPLPDAAVHHKYLSSHLRTATRTVLEPFPIVKNSWYFALLHGRDRHAWDDIHTHLVHYTAGGAGPATSALRAARRSKPQFDYFMQRVTEGQQRGLERGRSGRRKLASFGPAEPGRFKPFPTIDAGAGRLTVCFVSNEYPPDDFGGIGRFTCDLAETMAAQGHQLHVVTQSADHDRIDWENGVWIHRVRHRHCGVSSSAVDALPYAGNLRHCGRIHEEVRRLDARFRLDMVSAPLWNSEGLVCQLDGRLPTVLTLMTSQKTVGEIDPTLNAGRLWQQQIAIERQTVRSAAHIHAISQAILEKTLGDYGPAAGEAAVCHLGVRDVRAAFPRRRVADGEIRVLVVGRLEPRKGTDVLLAAAERLCAEDSRVRVVLVGKDAGGNGVKSYAHQFASRAGRLIDSGRVQFAGAVSDVELQQHYADADLFVLPSRFESFGLVLLEAMCFGLPLVAARTGGIGEIVTDDVGILVDPGDVDGLVTAIRRLVNAPQLRQELGEAARRQFVDRWSIDSAARRTAELYARYAENHRRRIAASPPATCDGEGLAERVAGIAVDEPLLQGLDARVVRSLLDPVRNADILDGVVAAWYRSDKTFVRKTFAAILGRPADAEAIAFFAGMLGRGDSRRDVVAHIVASPEARSLDISDEWLRLLPVTDTLEKRPAIFRIWSVSRHVPTLLERNGPIRRELRRRRQRRRAERTMRHAA